MIDRAPFHHGIGQCVVIRQARTMLHPGLRLADLIPAWLGDIILRNFRFHIAPR